MRLCCQAGSNIGRWRDRAPTPAMQRPMIAAERTGRRCCAVELDPAYCDVAVRRWEMATGRTASRD